MSAADRARPDMGDLDSSEPKLFGQLFYPAAILVSRPDAEALNPLIDIWISTKLAQARALALACRPVGNTAHRVTLVSDVPCRKARVGLPSRCS